ncbi:MAG TPA: response regulator transcription factor [Gammaproteobacteria bacterium]
MPADRPRTVLVVDDDERFAATLGRSLERRGFAVRLAHSVEQALAALAEAPPEATVVDLRIGDDDGLSLIQPLRRAGPDMRIVVLTGYASIATAVKAVKLGADDYLAKPTTAGAVAAALGRGEGTARDAPAAERPMSPRRLEWEHIQRVLEEHGGNVSATARALQMHRRTLQRKLAKRPAPG